MGFRFHKSVKIVPGVKVNFNKKSSSITFGGKGAHYTINSKGRSTTTVSIPGTGISYSESSGGSHSRGNKRKTNKWLTKCLKWLFIIIGYGLLAVLALTAFAFVWIPAVPVLIYFLKSEKFKENRKRNSLICGAILITSLSLFIASIIPHKLNGISAYWGIEKTYDIGETIEVQLNLTPANGDLKELKLSNTDLAEMTFADGKVSITFTSAGKDDLYFIANGDIKSETYSVTVIDKEADKMQSLKE